jgi:DNA-binding IclR family transcriptional regulator
MLEFFGDARRPLRAVEIAKMLDLQPSTADHLLKSMVDSGHLVFDARMKTYRPSPRLIGFSSWLVDTFGADNRLRALVRDVQARCGMVVTLTTPNDIFMQVIDAVIPEGSQTERGLRISVFGSAIGSAYLATLGSDDLERLAYRARVAPEDLPKIREIIHSINAAGFADGPSGDGSIWSLAQALPLPEVQIPLIIGLAGPAETVRPNRNALHGLITEAIARWIAPAQE